MEPPVHQWCVYVMVQVEVTEGKSLILASRTLQSSLQIEALTFYLSMSILTILRIDFSSNVDTKTFPNLAPPEIAGAMSHSFHMRNSDDQKPTKSSRNLRRSVHFRHPK